MTYLFDLILKKTNREEYALFTREGKKIFELRSKTEFLAHEEAVRFMSSWNSVKISIENSDEQEK